MSRSRSALAAALAALCALTLVAGACSSDESGSKKTTTTEKSSGEKASDEKKSDSGSSTTEPEQTTSTVSDKEFDSTIKELEAKLTAAGTDQCQLFAIFSSPTPDPSGKDQGKQAVEFISKLLNAVADAAPADQAQQAQALKTAATDLTNEAEAAGYSDSFLNGGQPPKALSSTEFTQAIQTIGSSAQTKCAPTTSAAPGN
ncbi:MAG: hypothetical protein ACOYOP_02000 [Microthrixaceae bacterium]